jgi:hypothetical protein
MAQQTQPHGKICTCNNGHIVGNGVFYKHYSKSNLQSTAPKTMRKIIIYKKICTHLNYFST